MNLRLNRNGNVTVSARWWVLHGDQLSVDIAIQLIVDIEVALVLQRRAASGAPETVNMQVLVLDTHEDTTVWRAKVFAFRTKPGSIQGGSIRWVLVFFGTITHDHNGAADGWI